MRKCSKISRSVLAGILAASMLAITACGGGNESKNTSTSTSGNAGSSEIGSGSAAETGGATTKDEMVIIFNGDHGNVNMAVSVGNNASALTSMCTNYLVDNYYLEDGSYEVGVCDRSLAESYEWD